ncbi:ATPase, AAA-type, core [Metarhizium album ARSEF 1941]|uniref:ATPase, AAA-type, core n=1 Tax=Metarhizium album (strain ARSEF 1941) TaxID=1081103 RepID=A0A0B2WG64_METAS|nr:ATPase, AAA-type, core [Metarhizium album ARSEF 1941]KHN94986.1 ATPase, AAA-type, core [Metarhizium album ARSEF 1941]
MEGRDIAKGGSSASVDDNAAVARREEEGGKEGGPAGMVPRVQTLYRKTNRKGKEFWSLEKGRGGKRVTDLEQLQSFAIIKKCKKADRNTFELVSVVIQSPHLLDVLDERFRGYPEYRTDLAQVELEAPFGCFLHRWDAFKAARDADGQQPDAQELVNLLYDIMEKELCVLMRRMGISIRQRSVPFDGLWMIFAPGCDVAGKVNGMYAGAVFINGSYRDTPQGTFFVLSCKNIDRNAIKGWNLFEVKIGEYVGEKPLASLEYFPLQYGRDSAGIRQQLRTSGEGFEKLQNYSYRHYEGVALYHKYNCPEMTGIRIKGDIILDWATWAIHSPGNGPTLRPLTATQCSRVDDADDERRRSLNWRAWYRGGTTRATSSAEAEKPLTEDQLIYTSPTVCGYSFSNRRWMRFFTNCILPRGRTRALESLAVADRKSILAATKQHIFMREYSEGTLNYNSKGVVIHLRGGPGTGKTYTAEAIADAIDVPLYTLTANDLIAVTFNMKDTLNVTLDMLDNWNAVLLIDKSDEFLRQCVASDTKMREMKSILLDCLDHFKGVVLFSSSFIQEMDETFESKISLTVDCGPLDKSTREKVWKSLLDNVMPCFGSSVRTDPEALGWLASWKLNGNEIKNIVRRGTYHATAKSEPLRDDHLLDLLWQHGIPSPEIALTEAPGYQSDQPPWALTDTAG